MGATTTNRRRASWIAAPLIGLSLIIGGTLASGAALAASQSADGPAINRTLFGGVARDLSIQELTAVNRARGITFPNR
jgi:hypothetical protein